ncbi:hypothetical protein GCM10027347_61550 [Larkinella harenae]
MDEPNFGDLFGLSVSNRKIKTYSVGDINMIFQVIEYPDGALAERRKERNGLWTKWEMIEREEVERRIKAGLYKEVLPPFTNRNKINPSRSF